MNNMTTRYDFVFLKRPNIYVTLVLPILVTENPTLRVQGKQTGS